MFKKKEKMKEYADKAKKSWEERMKFLKIDNTNIMIEQKPEDVMVVGDDSGTFTPPPIVFKQVVMVEPEIKPKDIEFKDPRDPRNQSPEGGDPVVTPTTPEVTPTTPVVTPTPTPTVDPVVPPTLVAKPL